MSFSLRPAFGENTFSGAYLDNGLGCFVTTKLASLLAKETLKNIRYEILSFYRILFTIAPYEEIGMFGSRVLCNQFRPDVILATDVSLLFKQG